MPLGLGENIADAVMATGEEASPDENARIIFAAEPAQGRCVSAKQGKRGEGGGGG